MAHSSSSTLTFLSRTLAPRRSSGRLAGWCVALAALSAVPSLAWAQEAVQVQPDVANSRFEFTGAINTPGVYVRSGPSEDYYPTMKLDQGNEITVVGIKNEWLKIRPPAGSFCYVSKLYVDRRGDGSVGRVNKPQINVRAGSSLNPLKTTVLTTLDIGTDVQIVGMQDEYYKIVPPPDCYLYVDKEFVDPVKAISVSPPIDVQPSVDVQPAQPTPVIPISAGATTQPSPVADSPGATTHPSESQAAVTPTTQPAIAVAPPAPPSPDPVQVAQSKYDDLEADFTSASAMPLEQQPCQELTTRYIELLKQPAITPAMARMADFRLQVLGVRRSAQQRLDEIHELDQQTAARTLALTAENEELQQRMDQQRLDTYTAVGTLQPSSLQFGAQTLYRLTDPANGRTVVYLHGDDAKLAPLLGQFVGVRGQVSTDDRLTLKVIPVTDIAAVDQAQVNGKVQANIVPPSLLSQPQQASITSP